MKSNKAVIHKINYYALWLKEMPMSDRRGWLGKWVKDRIKLLSEAL